MAAVSAGDSGAVSDIVVATFDLIFTDEKSGVGFNTIGFTGESLVEVRVYSTTYVFLGMMTTLADPSGANFIGVWSPDTIGRINIFDPDGGAEGADRIQAWEVAPCPADFDGSSDVGVNDLLFLLGAWGACP